MNPNCYLFQELANNTDAFTFPFPGLPNGPSESASYSQPPFAVPQHMNYDNGNGGRPYRKRPYGNNNSYRRGGKQAKQENFIDFCDVCDRGFKTKEKREEHFSQHVKCSEAGCNFEAHFKIVEIHRRNLHGPNGVKIKLETPEDIKKWREERRKNFPTHDRILQKKAEEKERVEAGAVLQPQSFGKFNSGKKMQRGGFSGRNFRGNRQRGNFRGGRGRRNFTQSTRTREIQQSSDQGNPLDILATENNVKGDDGSDCEPSDETDVKPIGSGLGGLAQLMSNYDSDESQSEKDQGPPKPCVLQPDEPKTPTHKQTVQSANSQDPQKSFSQPGKHQNPPRGQRNPHPPYQSRLGRPSLLRKLLEPEIRRERNDILQCVRYIVSNNFFDDLPGQ